MTLFLSFMAYSAVVFYLGMRHERAKLTDTLCDRLFVPHRPRLLVSPHWPRVEAINPDGAGAGLSQTDKEIA